MGKARRWCSEIESSSNTFISRARCRASAFSRTAADSFESLELDASCSKTARSMLNTSTSSWHTTDAARRSRPSSIPVSPKKSPACNVAMFRWPSDEGTVTAHEPLVMT